MRNSTHIALCLIASAALAGCSYDAINGAFEINVTGIPASAIRAEVVVTDSSGGAPLKREPHFGAGVYVNQALLLTLPAIAPGTFNVQVTAYDIDATPLAIGNATGTFASVGDAGPLLVVPVALSSSGLQGTFGTPCIVTGSSANSCSGGLVCKQYGGSDVGICTHSCADSSACESIPPGSTCQAFEGASANRFCQWECGAPADGGVSDGGTTCPPNTVCGPAVSSSGGQRFCQGSL